MCAHNVAADGITIQCQTLSGLLEVPPVVAAYNVYTTMIYSLLYMFDSYDKEDSGEHWKPNLTHVELHSSTCWLWFVNCVDNLRGDKEPLASLVRTVMEYDSMFLF
jgi:hypothetical protein